MLPLTITDIRQIVMHFASAQTDCDVTSSAQTDCDQTDLKLKLDAKRFAVLRMKLNANRHCQHYTKAHEYGTS